MTVRQLREFLEGLPEDLEVLVQVDHERAEFPIDEVAMLVGNREAVLLVIA